MLACAEPPGEQRKPGKRAETLRTGPFQVRTVSVYTARTGLILKGEDMSPTDIADRLTEAGVVPTPQRLEIAEILLARPQHLSAEQILDTLRKNGSTVSKATVYNTLHLFGEKGLVREVIVDPARTFFDSTTHPHHHFYNVDSGELCDIPDDRIEVLGLPELPDGTEQESVEVMIRIRDRRPPAAR